MEVSEISVASFSDGRVIGVSGIAAGSEGVVMLMSVSVYGSSALVISKSSSFVV